MQQRPTAVASPDLTRAIQALDDAGAAAEASPRLRRRVFQAWALFLDLAERMERGVASRQQLALVVEARVLSCVVRFVRGRKTTQGEEVQQPTWRRWSCGATPSPCVGDAIRSALCCFLFQLTRHASTAVLVVRSGLLRVLLDECRVPMSSEEAPTPCLSRSPFDAQDVAVAVDPHDWSTRALSVALRNEGPTCEVFLLPIGARSLAFLLRGERLPANEIDEFGLANSHSVSPPPSPVRHKGRRNPRRLPSIFTFPIRSDQVKDGAERCPVCCTHVDVGVWRVVTRASTRLHCAVRALVLLALHLPMASPERKAFVRNGGLETLRYIATGQHVSDSALTASMSEQIQATGADLSIRLIREMAMAGLSLFEVEDRKSRTSASTSPNHRCGRSKADRAVPTAGSPLREKLKAVAAASYQNQVKRNQEEFDQQRAAERESIRLRVLELYEKAAETRSYLLQGLSVLSIGRDHPGAANQSIVDWLDSFLTIDKKEQLRQEEEALRHRRVLGLQYKIEERRRREREDRNWMAAEDHDILDEHTVERDEAKRDAYAELHREMRELTAKEEEENISEGYLTDKKRQAARAEALRIQLETDDRRRQTVENERMKKEDTYFVEKILREKQARDEYARRAKTVDPVANQQKRIEQMRRQDDERRQNEREQREMRVEDLLARQHRYLEMEEMKKEKERERNARKQMEAEERLLRIQWKRFDELLAKERQDEEKRRRAEERRLKRQNDLYWKQWQAAWVTTYDSYGNLYYYNQMSGVSQWENPFEQQTATMDVEET